jgi:hypothetical protein
MQSTSIMGVAAVAALVTLLGIHFARRVHSSGGDAGDHGEERVHGAADGQLPPSEGMESCGAT